MRSLPFHQRPLVDNIQSGQEGDREYAAEKRVTSSFPTCEKEVSASAQKYLHMTWRYGHELGLHTPAQKNLETRS